MGPSFFLFLAATLLLRVLILIIWDARIERKRLRILRDWIEDNEFTHLATISPEMLKRWRKLPFLELASHAAFKLVIHGKIAELRFWLVDYQFFGEGLTLTNGITTVLIMENASLELPIFCVRPKSLWDRFPLLWRWETNHFEENLPLSRQFLFRTTNASELRDYFRSEVADILLENPRACFEGNQKLLLFAEQRHHQVPSRDIEAFLHNGITLYSRFQMAPANK